VPPHQLGILLIFVSTRFHLVGKPGATATTLRFGGSYRQSGTFLMDRNRLHNKRSTSSACAASIASAVNAWPT
jgi:hypothetical protein